MKYRLKDGVSFNLINEKSIIKFDFDLSDYYNKETRIFEFPKGYVAFSLMSDVFNNFLFLLDLVEEVEDNVKNGFVKEYERKYITILLRNGYSNNSPSIKCNIELSKGYGKQEWGAELNKEYYILKILSVEEVK